MTWVGLYFSNMASVALGSLSDVGASETRVSFDQDIYVPEIPIFTGSKHPSFALAFAKFAANGLCLDHVLDRLTNEAAAARDQYHR